MLAEYGLEYAPVVDNSAFSGFYTMDADPANFDKKYHGSNAGVVQEYAYALSGNLADYEAMYKKLTTGRAGICLPKPQCDGGHISGSEAGAGGDPEFPQFL